MRSQLLVLLTLAFSLFPSSLAWSPEDHEIFKLRDDVIEAEGLNVTFYSFLGVPPSASLADITAANRKKSKQLHPDKAVPALIAARSKPKSNTIKPGDTKKPGVHVQKGPSQKERDQILKEATARYQRLSVIVAVLKGPQRQRYDHFLHNGFPRWRGTGYYYARFRPGLGSVLIGLFIVFGGAAHYGALYIGWKRQQEFVQRYVSHARRMAWGNDGGIPGLPSELQSNTAGDAAAAQALAEEQEAAMPLNRRQKRMQEKESKKKDFGKAAKTARNVGISKPVDTEPLEGPQGSKKKVIAENGKVLIVDSVGNVFLEQTTPEGETHEFLLDPAEIPKPTIFQTILFRLPVWCYSQTVGRVLGLGSASDVPLVETDQLPTEVTEEDAVKSALSANQNGEVKKRRTRAK